LRWFVRLGVGVLAVAWGLLLLAWLSLHWLILPHVEQWRGSLEQHASKALGISVKLGHIEVRSRGWVPSIELRQVQLLDAQGHAALTLPVVTAAVSPQSLLHLELRLDQLVIDGAVLEVRRDAQGHVFIAGLDASQTQGHATMDWLFKQHEVVVRGGSLQWVDELRGAPPLALTDVQLVVRNSLRRHQIRLDATPPTAWGQRFSLRGRFTQPLLARAGDWRRWVGNGYLDLPQADISALRRHADLPIDLTEGLGGLRAWAQVKAGTLESVTVDLALRAVEARLGPGLLPLRLEQVSGRLVGGLAGDAQANWFNTAVNKAGAQENAGPLTSVLDPLGGPGAKRQVSGRSLETRLSAQGLSFVTQDGLTWPSSDFSFKVQHQTQADGQMQMRGGQITAPQINLGVLASIGSRLPLGVAVNRLLKEAQPQGDMTGLVLSWSGPLDAPTTYQARATITGLSLVAKSSPLHVGGGGAGRPGVEGARIDLEANQAGGRSQVTLDGGRLVFPGVFSDPVLPFDRFSADIQWRIEPSEHGAAPQVTVKWNQVQFANADMQGEASGQWHTGEGVGPVAPAQSVAPAPGDASTGTPTERRGKGQRLPGHLQLDGRLTRGDASKISRYLPQHIPEPTRDYLRRALNQGQIEQATVRVQGDLADFPFVHAKTPKDGEFRFASKVKGATFAYVPDIPARQGEPAWVSPWPALTDISGEVEIDRDQLHIKNAQARVAGVALSKVNGDIRDLSQKGQATVRMEGQGRGELTKMLAFVESSPVGRWIGHALSGASASGNSDLNLRLNLPIFDLAASTVQGHVDLLGNDVRLRPDLPLFTQARGRVGFTHQGFSLPAGITTQVLGGELSVTGGTQADRSVRLSGAGVARADALQRTVEMGLLSRWAHHFAGQARYQVDLNMVQGRSAIDLRSDLVGWSSQLPAPLSKAAATPWPLRFQTHWSEDNTSTGSPLLEHVKLDVGSALQASYLRQWPSTTTPTAKVLRGTVGIGTNAPPLPASGVVGQAVLQKLNADEWSTLLKQHERTPERTPAATADLDTMAAYSPNQWRVRADEVLAHGLRLNEVEATALWERGEWRGMLNSSQAKGQLAWRPATPLQAGRLYARLARLSLASNQPVQPQGAPTALLAPPTAQVPALDVVVEDFELRGKRLGRLEVEAVNTATSSGPTGRGGFDWKLQRLDLIAPEAKLSATGTWSAVPTAEVPTANRQTELDFTLTVSDAGALLDRLGQPQAVRGGKGELVGQLRWRDSPLNPDPLSMSGHMKVDIGAGQFLRQEPGAVRLLGVLSLQALPRRLLLDFRDVFQEGFAFDNVTGDVAMNQGVATTTNLRMRGVQAVVLLEGSASLHSETQDLHVFVVPEINAGTASLAYAVINPALGLGTFLAQMFLRKPLAEANTREFRVTGPWGDPKVERVQRATPLAPTQSDGAAPAAPPQATKP
jgi:uncharacterized protein (TIGR02099 family)